MVAFKHEIATSRVNSPTAMLERTHKAPASAAAATGEMGGETGHVEIEAAEALPSGEERAVGAFDQHRERQRRDPAVLGNVRLNSKKESACSPRVDEGFRGVVIATPAVVDLSAPGH